MFKELVVISSNNRTFKNKNTFLFLLFIWTVLNLIQAAFTELSGDEAYYYVYSQYLAWGYFDHPPFLALMIRLGTTLLSGEIGVRLMSVFFTSGTLYLLWKLLPDHVVITKKSTLLFFGIASSILFFHPAGFMAIPDVPLLFFSALFLYVYRFFLSAPSFKNGFILGVVMAFMLYSKYHGILVITFTILSNIRLFVKKEFIFACCVGVLLFLPHLYWQYMHAFPSVKYHLSDRSDYPYHIEYTFEYLVGLLLMAGPFTFLIVYWMFFTFKPRDLFDRSLWVITIGIFGFFLFSTFKGRVEAHWTALAFLPMVVIVHRRLAERSQLRSWFLKLSGTTFFLILVVRAILAFDLLPPHLKIKNEFQGNRKFATDVEKVAGDLPVVFTNSYREASFYRFYTGKFGYSLNNIWYRKNQYDLWNFEEKLQGKKVLLVANYEEKGFQKTRLGDVERYLKVIPDFRSYANIDIDVLTDISAKKFHSADSLRLKLRMYNPYSYTIYFKRPSHKTVLVYSYFRQYNFFGNSEIFLPVDSLEARKFIDFPVNIGLPNEHGYFTLSFSLQTDVLQPGLNSRKIKLNVSK